VTLYSIRASKVWAQPVLSDLFETASASFTATRAWLYALKEGLKDSTVGAWSVLASSARVGGVTWTADTSDLWTDPSEVQWGATAADHAWIVMKSPTGDYGPFYMTIDYTHASDDFRASFYFTKSEPTLTGLLTTARPVATGDEWSHTGVIVHTDGTNVNHRGNLLQAHDGSFVWAVQMKGLGIFSSALLFNVMVRQSLRTDDTVGAASLHWSNRTTRLAQTDTFRLRMLHPADGSETDAAAVALGYGLVDGIARAPAISTDMATNTWPALPVDLFAVTGGKLALRGQLEDILWAPEYLVEDASATAGDIMQAVCMGPFWVPATEPILKP